MIWAIREILASLKDLWLTAEKRHQSIFRTGKHTGIEFLGPFFTILLVLANLATGLFTVYKRDVILIILAVAGTAIILFATFLALGGYLLWEFLRYDFASPINPLYHSNQ